MVLQTDVDSSIKGKQWPLSCYGPFRDKPCIHNFIEDQSFEEMRALAYEAKTNALTFQTLVSQIEQQIHDAQQKNELLYNVTYETLNNAVNLYNNCVDSSLPTNAANAFASSGGFGSTSAASNPFGQQQVPTTNSFGGNSSIFGGSASTFGTTSVFGAGTAAPAQTSVFGNSNTVTAPPATNSVFGLSATTTNSPFSLGQIQSQPQQDLGNIFGNAATAVAPASTTFNQQQPIFGGTASFGNFGGQQQQQPTAASSSIFGQANQTFGTTGASSIFGNAGALPQSNVFGTTQQQPSMFGTAQTTAPAPGLFSSVPIPAQQGANIFANAAAAQQSNIFGNAATTLPPATVENPFSTNSTFGTSAVAPPPPPSNVFGQEQQFSTPFGAVGPPSQQQSNTFGTSNLFQNQTAAVIPNGLIYSPISAVTESDLNWFKSDHFELGSIPTVPPPRELCT